MADPTRPPAATPPSPGVWRPVPCPTCAESSGYVRGVHAGADGVEIVYRCRECGHEWTRERPLLSGCRSPH